MNAQEFEREIKRLNNHLEKQHAVFAQFCKQWAEAERTYRKAKPKAWVTVKASGVKLLAKETEDLVASMTADDRFQRDVAEGIKTATLEAIRSLRTEISGIQSIGNMVKGEMELGR